MQQKSVPLTVRGFTLMEMMITVAIIGILAAVAMPQYRDYVTRGRLSDAVSGLSTVRAQMERHFQDNRTYASVSTTFISPCMVTPRPVYGNFTISCDPDPTGTAFTLQAVGSGPVSDFTFSINEQGVQRTVASPWSGPCTGKWLLKRGETC